MFLLFTFNGVRSLTCVDLSLTFVLMRLSAVIYFAVAFICDKFY